MFGSRLKLSKILRGMLGLDLVTPSLYGSVPPNGLESKEPDSGVEREASTFRSS